MDPQKGDELTTCENNRFVQVVPASKGCIFENSNKKVFFLLIFFRSPTLFSLLLNLLYLLSSCSRGYSLFTVNFSSFYANTFIQ